MHMRTVATSGVLLVVVMAYASVAWGKQDGYAWLARDFGPAIAGDRSARAAGTCDTRSQRNRAGPEPNAWMACVIRQRE